MGKVARCRLLPFAFFFFAFCQPPSLLYFCFALLCFRGSIMINGILSAGEAEGIPFIIMEPSKQSKVKYSVIVIVINSLAVQQPLRVYTRRAWDYVKSLGLIIDSSGFDIVVGVIRRRRARAHPQTTTAAFVPE
jgi:hypothetical protein